MKKTYLLLILFSQIIIAQNQFHQPFYLNIEMDSITKEKILSSLDMLFLQISEGQIADSLLSNHRQDYNKAVFNMFKNLGADNNNNNDFYKKQIINFYPISKSQYWISIAYIGTHETEPPILRSIVSVIANVESESVKFSIPLHYLTKDWKKKEIGNITYHYTDSINEDRAKHFDKKNTEIAEKLG